MFYIFQSIRPAMSQQLGPNADYSPLAMFAYFVSRCRTNLHLIIAFSPIGDAFRNRLRQFPSLINCCTIDWFQVQDTHNDYRTFNFSSISICRQVMTTMNQYSISISCVQVVSHILMLRDETPPLVSECAVLVMFTTLTRV